MGTTKKVLTLIFGCLFLVSCGETSQETKGQIKRADKPAQLETEKIEEPTPKQNKKIQEPKQAPTEKPEELIQGLSHEDYSIQYQAMQSLSKSTDPQVVPLLSKALADESKGSEFRRRVVVLLGDIGDKRAIEPLTEILRQEIPDQREQRDEIYVIRCAAIALGKIGEKGSDQVVEPLVKALKHKDDWVRGISAEWLGRIGDKRALEPLMEALSSRSLTWQYSQIRGIKALGNLRDPRAVPLLKPYAESDSLGIKATALGALCRLGVGGTEKDAEIYENLTEQILESRSGNTYDCRDGNRALGKIRNKLAVDALIRNLRSAYWQAPDAAAKALAQHKDDPRVFDALITALGYPSRDYQWCDSLHSGVAWALGEIGDKRAIEPLRKLFEDENEDAIAHMEAASALAKLGGKEVVDDLIRGLKRTRRWWLRVTIAKALTDLKDPQGLEEARVTTLIQKGDTEALIEMGPKITDELVVALQNRYGKTRGNVVKVLQKIGEPAVVALLNELSNPYFYARDGAVDALEKLGVDKERLFQCWCQVLQSENAEVAAYAAKKLGKSKNARAIAPLVQALKSKEYWPRSASAEALVSLGNKEAVPLLIKALEEDKEDRGSCIISALVGLDPDSAVLPLIRALEKGGFYTRIEAAKALGKLKDPRALEPLKRGLEDKESMIRKAAQEAIEKIQKAQVKKE